MKDMLFGSAKRPRQQDTHCSPRRMIAMKTCQWHTTETLHELLACRTYEHVMDASVLVLIMAWLMLQHTSLRIGNKFQCGSAELGSCPHHVSDRDRAVQKGKAYTGRVNV